MNERSDNTQPQELLPCPFCGSAPEFPDIEEVYGSYYEAGCNDCGIAAISIQIINYFDFDDTPSRDDAHESWDQDNCRYGDSFIKIVRNEAIRMWNKRSPNNSQAISSAPKVHHEPISD